MTSSTPSTPMPPEEFRTVFRQLQDELARIIVGQEAVVQALLVACFAGGHVLLEGVPGLGKTLLAKSFAKALGLSFKRVQCTPDLMPADILGTEMVVNRDGKNVFEFAPGPVFTHVLLADEINRATPKTQSALLEAMAENQVSVSGNTFRLPDPFFVMATQNPIEMEGVYSLPEAQLDRFLFRVFILSPSESDLARILRQTTVSEIPAAKTVLSAEQGKEWIVSARRLVREVLVAQAIEAYVVRLIMATQPDGVAATGARRFVRYGASPRGAQAILMGAKVLALVHGRVNVSREDVDEVMMHALNHRVVLSFEAEAERRTAVDVLRELAEPVQIAE